MPCRKLIIGRQACAHARWVSLRDLTLLLDFLKGGIACTAQTSRDGEGASWQSNSYALTIASRPLHKGDTLTLRQG